MEVLGAWRSRYGRAAFVTMGVSDTPEAAAAYPYSDAERARIERMRREGFVGAPDQVGARLRELARAFGVPEMAIVTWTHDEGVRRRSYELLAAEFGMRAAGDRPEAAASPRPMAQ